MTNTIIRASAGSGKTFRLSNEFLNAVFGGASLDSILASTFTRKAAGEIADRIFTKLADAALDPAERKKLDDYLNYPESNDLEKTLQTILAELARNMYRLRVGTLDSYFNKIATVFSLELGLPLGWSILDDAEYPRLLEESVREVFNESKRNDAKNLMYLLQKGEEAPGMMKDLVGLANNMLPLVRATTRNAWEHEAPERLEKYTCDLISDREIAELLERIEAVADDQLPKDKDNNPHPNYITSRDNLEHAVRSQDWKFFFDAKNTLIKNIMPTLSDPTVSCKYFYKDVRQEAPELFAIITTLLPHAKSVLIKVLIGQTRATYGLLKMVAEKLDSIMERERKFRYEDITRIIAEYGFKHRLDSLQHRLNAETKHLLLDEFQDTSLQQWKILEPLALQTAGDASGTYFCVGDEKQSIYSWRGGEAAVFGSMKNRLEQELQEPNFEEITMETTRRCAKPIIEAVNELFGKVQYSDTVCKVSKEAGALWQRRFKEHDSASEKPGYCVLEELPPFDKEESKKDAHVKYVADRIERLIPIVKNNPELKNGIGVLVSTNDFGTKIVSALKARGIETGGSGAALLESPAVRHVVSALVFAEHPGDTVARFHLAHGPLAETIGLDQYDDSSCSRIIRDELVNRGYGSVIGDYIEMLANSCDAIELERLEKLREVAWRFDEVSTGIRTRRFIEMLNKECVASQHAARVQVMTIHRSKGLEFDIVVLPQLEGNLKGRIENEKHVTGNEVENDPTSPINFVLRRVNESLQQFLPQKYQAVFERRVQREVEESLCELYVAMTRAIRSLIMIVPFREKNKDGSDKKNDTTNFANVLRELPRTKSPSAANILYELGDPNWFGNIPKATEEFATQPHDELIFNLNKEVVLHHVPRIVPSKRHGQTVPTKSVKKKKTAYSPEEAALKGTVLHACLEHGVEWLDDDRDVGENELRELIDETLDGREPTFSVDEVLAEFRSVYHKPEIVAALSRSRYFPDKNPELERERRFAVWIKTKIMRGSIDRLVVQRDPSGIITNIEILDYKTGDSTDDVDALMETYRNQMDDYRQAVCELYGVDSGIVKTTLVFVMLGRVVTLPTTL
jgi:ATP-dependent exoDNAse (exonuclease V) beta subunit